MQSRVGKIFVFSSFSYSKHPDCQIVNFGLVGMRHLGLKAGKCGNTRFSRAGGMTFWTPFGLSGFQDARHAGTTCVRGRDSWKHETDSVGHPVIRFLQSDASRLGEKRAMWAYFFSVFRAFLHSHAEKDAPSRGQKKCFLSRTKNHSAVIEMRLSWKKSKNKVEMWIYVSKKGWKQHGT